MNYSLNEDLDPLLITEPQHSFRIIMHVIHKLLPTSRPSEDARNRRAFCMPRMRASTERQ